MSKPAYSLMISPLPPHVDFLPSVNWKVGWQGVDPNHTNVVACVYKLGGLWHWHILIDQIPVATGVNAYLDVGVSFRQTAEFLCSSEYQGILQALNGCDRMPNSPESES